MTIYQFLFQGPYSDRPEKRRKRVMRVQWFTIGERGRKHPNILSGHSLKNFGKNYTRQSFFFFLIPYQIFSRYCMRSLGFRLAFLIRNSRLPINCISLNFHNTVIWTLLTLYPSGLQITRTQTHKLIFHSTQTAIHPHKSSTKHGHTSVLRAEIFV